MCGELPTGRLLLVRVSVQQVGGSQCWGLVSRYVCLSATGHKTVLQVRGGGAGAGAGGTLRFVPLSSHFVCLFSSIFLHHIFKMTNFQFLNTK